MEHYITNPEGLKKDLGFVKSALALQALNNPEADSIKVDDINWEDEEEEAEEELAESDEEEDKEDKKEEEEEVIEEPPSKR